MKCEICSNKIKLTFMNKIVGTSFGTGKKKKYVCSECQSRFSTSEIKDKLNL
jgi:DNA-directed RNA polymerase subunit RPC12/RpoP